MWLRLWNKHHFQHAYCIIITTLRVYTCWAYRVYVKREIASQLAFPDRTCMYIRLTYPSMYCVQSSIDVGRDLWVQNLLLDCWKINNKTRHEPRNNIVYMMSNVFFPHDLDGYVVLNLCNKSLRFSFWQRVYCFFNNATLVIFWNTFPVQFMGNIS